MKTDAQALTEWTTDAIFFDMSDGPGINRVYTRDAFENLAKSLLHLAMEPRLSEPPHAVVKTFRDAVLPFVTANRGTHALNTTDHAKREAEIVAMLQEYLAPRKLMRYTGLQAVTSHFQAIMMSALVEAAKQSGIYPTVEVRETK